VISKISVRNLIFENKGYLSVGLILLTLNRVASMAIPYAGKFLVDEVILKLDIEMLKLVIGFVILALIVQAVSFFVAAQILGIGAQKNIANLRTQFYHHIIQLPLSFFKNGRSGALTSRLLVDFDSVRNFLGTGMVELFSGVFSILLAFVLMLLINFKLTLLIITPIIVFSGILYLIFQRQKHHFKNQKEVVARVASDLTESFIGIKLIKGIMDHSDSTELMRNNFTDIFHTVKVVITSQNVLKSLGVLFLGATAVVLMWFGGIMVIHDEISIGELTSFTMYLLLMVAPFFNLVQTSNQFMDAFASVNRINEILKLDQEKANETAKKHLLEGDIELKNVSFNFGKQQILKNISFKLSSNTVTAIIGKSGVGKTTLSDLIAAFYTPKSGEILIDNYPLSELNVNDYRAQIGFVFQEPYLFNISVKQNILLAKPEATEAELLEAMNAANVIEFLPQLTNGADTIIGENGSKISIGQKQRIAIARAFLSNPRILILDEITSNLDPHNEDLITQSLQALMQNRTIIVIAHRLNTIKTADQVLLLDQGKLIGKGTLEQLQKEHKAYFSFLEK
jgi:subfamily B ATP-binding cassette protein MsbA